MNPRKNEAGFSYIDVIIALVILFVGLLASTGALTANLVRSYETEKQVIAKQIALSTIESIFSARDIARDGAVDGWETVGNVGSNPVGGIPQGIFVNGLTPIREDMGWDGLAGTEDDACAADTVCQVPGRPSNTSNVIDGFRRRIVITDLPDPERPSPPHAVARRRIDVTVRYQINQLEREQVVSTIISNYRE
jgi:type II secretory pathway pseudopilin PulG